jgi:hypothetical protein
MHLEHRNVGSLGFWSSAKPDQDLSDAKLLSNSGEYTKKMCGFKDGGVDHAFLNSTEYQVYLKYGSLTVSDTMRWK